MKPAVFFLISMALTQCGGVRNQVHFELMGSGEVLNDAGESASVEQKVEALVAEVLSLKQELRKVKEQGGAKEVEERAGSGAGPAAPAPGLAPAPAVEREDDADVKKSEALIEEQSSTTGCSSLSKCVKLGQGAHGTAYLCSTTGSAASKEDMEEKCKADSGYDGKCSILKTPDGKSGIFKAELNDEIKVMSRMNAAKVPCTPKLRAKSEGACLEMSYHPGLPYYGDGGWRENKNGNKKIPASEGIWRKVQDILKAAEATGTKGHDRSSGNWLVPKVDLDQLKKEECPVWMIDLPEYTYGDDDEIRTKRDGSLMEKSDWFGSPSNCKSLATNLFEGLQC